MPNPRGINQYTKGRGGSRSSAKKGESLTAASKRIAKSQSSRAGFNLGSGTSSAAHEAFIRQKLAEQAARKKKKKRR